MDVDDGLMDDTLFQKEVGVSGLNGIGMYIIVVMSTKMNGLGRETVWQGVGLMPIYCVD
jgi:hypothetical protein